MQSKDDIIAGIESSMDAVAKTISALSDEEFVRKPNPDKWSMAEEFDHILKSNTAISSALKRSPIAFKWKFGKPNRRLRTYDEVYDRYFEKLKKIPPGTLAPASFISAPNQQFDKSDMLSHWESTKIKLSSRLPKWSDKSLDSCLIPHPLLGKMIMREILFFTDFHTQHHGNSLKTKKSNLA